MVNEHELSVLAHANGFTFWHYRTKVDSLDIVTSAHTDYFKQARDMLRPGDMILVNAVAGAGLVVVTDTGVVNLTPAGSGPFGNRNVTPHRINN